MMDDRLLHENIRKDPHVAYQKVMIFGNRTFLATIILFILLGYRGYFAENTTLHRGLFYLITAHEILKKSPLKSAQSQALIAIFMVLL